MAVSKLSDILPDVIAILIGFTFTFITLILTSSGSNIERLKQKETDKKLQRYTPILSLQYLLSVFPFPGIYATTISPSF